ncbi:hypothetical protein ACTXT7_009709 [Hymenolepis weldensis]
MDIEPVTAAFADELINRCINGTHSTQFHLYFNHYSRAITLSEYCPLNSLKLNSFRRFQCCKSQLTSAKFNPEKKMGAAQPPIL